MSWILIVDRMIGDPIVAFRRSAAVSFSGLRELCEWRKTVIKVYQIAGWVLAGALVAIIVIVVFLVICKR
ncbi:hypothetical protein COOONC_20264 [Cooperia oncophora]